MARILLILQFLRFAHGQGDVWSPSTGGSAPVRRTNTVVDATSTLLGGQAPLSIDPPQRDERKAVRRDSLSIRWTLPQSEPPVAHVELQHDGGFGGNFTQTLAIRSEYTTFQLNGLEPGSTIRWRLRAVAADGTSSAWSPETGLMVLAEPQAPEELQAKFHPLAIRPELCWTPPSDMGGGGQDSVRIESYHIWMHLDDQVKLLGEVPGDRSCFHLDLPQFFSTSFRFSVNAINQVYEGPRSAILELTTAGPPGTPGPIAVDNVTGSSIFLAWTPPKTRQVDCNAAFSICSDLQAQFAQAPAASGYELYWDAGTGADPATLIYAGADPAAEVAVSPSVHGCYQFRVRATNAGGQSAFGDIRSVSNLPLSSPSGLTLESMRAGAVTVSWNEAPPSACVWWYELQILDVALGNSTSIITGLSQIEVEELNTLHLYNFSVRLCDAAQCSSFSNVLSVVPSRLPLGPTAPYALHYEDGLLTVTWSAFTEDMADGTALASEPFIETFHVLAAGSEQGPYTLMGSVSANLEPQVAFPCNESNGTQLWPSAIWVKIVAAVSNTWSTEPISAESEASRIFCAPAPLAPAAPVTHVVRTATRRDVPSLFDLEVQFSLLGQPAEVVDIHTGWTVELTRKSDNMVLETLLITDPGLQFHTFTSLPPGLDVTLRYAVLALSGTGPWSPVTLQRVNLGPPPPEMQVESSDDESVQVTWTWAPSIDNDQLLEYYLYVDWIDGHFTYMNLQQPTYRTQSPEYLVNCTDGALGGLSRSRQRLWFRVAAVSPAGIGELSERIFWICGSVPDQPVTPSLEEVGSSWALLGWTQPDLHGAALHHVRVVLGTALGPTSQGFSNSEFIYPAPSNRLNVTANLSQPLQFAISVISDVGESPLSPWLSFDKLALPPLPPRLSIQSSTDSQVTVEWSLDRAKERGAYHTGYYVYVSVDGTTWPDPDSGFVATWQDEFTTTYTMDCTLSGTLGGQSRSKQFLWFKVASRSAVGRGPLSIAVARRCSAPPSAPVNLTLESSTFDADGLGWSLLAWQEPSELNGALLLGYKVYVDANTADPQDLYTLLDVIEDPEQRSFRHENIIQGQSYKYKVTAVSETGEGSPNEAILVPALVPLQPAAPVLLDDCTTSWYTSKALCTYPHNYELAAVTVDVRESADINAPRVNPFVTVLQGTILTVASEVLGADGRLYLEIPSLGGWLWDDTPLDPSNPLSTRLPALKLSWSWQDDEVRALGGSPLTAWYVYRSADGVTWDSYSTLASTARDTSFDCAVAEVGLPFWVRVSAVNDVGESPPSDPLKLRCSLPPGLQPAPTQLEEDVDRIVVGFNPQNLHGAELLYHRLTYAFVDDVEGILNPIQLDVPGSETFVNISQLLPFSSYIFKVQAMTESGMSLDPGWQINMTTGSAMLLEPPSYVSSDGTRLQFTLRDLSGIRQWPADAMPSYNLYITADDREWPTTPSFMTSSLLFDHDCTQTPDHTQLDGSGNVVIVDQSYNFVYVKVSLGTATGPGSLSNASTFFCSPLPSQPVLEVFSSDGDQITLKWANPDLFGAPLIGYNVYVDDGLGGDLTLNKYVPAEEVVYDETNQSVVMSIHPVVTGRWYRSMVTVRSAAGESTGQIVNAQTCQAPPNPVITRLPSSTSLIVRWNATEAAEVCTPQGYVVISEIINYTGEVNQSLVLLTSNTIAANQLEHQLDNLVSQAEYRFQVRAFVPGGTRDSGWSSGFAAGLPDQMAPVSHVLNASFATSIYLEWTIPDMNYGTPLGFELFRNDGPGTAMRGRAEDCIAADCSQNPACVLQPISRIPDATGCFIPGLSADTAYRFWIRAVNEYGPGPISDVAEISVGALPLVSAPTLVSAAGGDNCTMTWQWPPAIERGKVVHSYDLKVERMNTSTELLLSFDGTSSEPNRNTTALVTTELWSEAVPGDAYRAALRARSDVAESDWSPWSVSSFCISEPQAPNPPRRASVEIKAGRIELIWDVATSQMAGNDDVDALGVEYDIWGKPYALSLETSWRRLYQLPAYEGTPSGSATALSPSVAFDTFPETPVTTAWAFRLRIANRNGYGPFSPELHLSTGQLASSVQQLSSSVAANGQIQLSWLAPISDGYIPLTGYQARCGTGPWEDVANTQWSHELVFSPPTGLVTCEVRALNAVGQGPVAQTSLTLL